MTTYQAVLEAALSLSEAERSELVDALLVSGDIAEPPPELSAAWRAEIERRSAEYDRGEVTPIPWAEVRAGILRKYGDDA